MIPHQTVRDRKPLVHLGQLRGARQNVRRLRQFSQASDVVLMQMREDRDPYVGDVIAAVAQLFGERCTFGDVEGGEAAVEVSRDAAREVIGVGHRPPVLTRVEEHQSLFVLDHVHVDRTRSGPTTRSVEPPQQWRAVALHVFRTDLHGSSADHRNPFDKLHHAPKISVPTCMS